MIDGAALAFRGGGQQHFLDDLRQGRRRAFHRPGQRIAAQGAETDRALDRCLAVTQAEAFIIHHQDQAIARHRRSRRGQIQRHDFDAFEVDVLPDVQLGPVAEGEHADGFALGLAGIVEPPQFRPLVPGVPAMTGRTEAEHALFRPAFLLVAPRAAKGRVKTVFIQRLFQALGLPQVGMQAAMVKRVDALCQGFRVLVDQQIHPGFLRRLVTQLVHGAEFPRGIYVQQGKRRRRRIKGLLRQVQHDRGILAHRIQHDGLFGFRHHLAHDVDAFGFKPLQMGQSGCCRRGGLHPGILVQLSVTLSFSRVKSMILAVHPVSLDPGSGPG